MSLRYQLIELLSDGNFRSGEWLGRTLGVSRAAVWKHVRSLGELGLDVHAVRGKGYRLAVPFQPLDEAFIRRVVSPAVVSRMAAIDVFRDIDSTSDYLKRCGWPDAGMQGQVCIAEWQSAGRGRRGRRWVSPYGASLYLSLAWQVAESTLQSGGLSLVAAIAVLRSLQQSGVTDAGLKWPNDILLQGKKLAGILLDVSGESRGPYRVVVGIGLNLRLSTRAAGEIDQPWADLSNFGSMIDRNRLACALIENLVQALDEFEEQGLDAFMHEWKRYDVIAGKAVELRRDTQVVATGIARGVDAHGALMIENQGVTANFHAGEVSLRLA